MERFYGEKSYRPVNFEIDFWGTNAGSARDYEDFQQRKILGNILLAAYYTPVTMQEISMELGVSMPYLEDEVRILLKRSYLLCLPGNGAGNEKYLANLPIFTVDCTKAIEERLRLLTESTVKRFSDFLNSPGGFAENFGDRFANENALRWQILMLCMHFALLNTENDLTQRYGELPKGGLYTAIRGGAGIVWGRCAEEKEDREPGAPQDGISGIYTQLAADKRGSVIAMNFRQTINGQHYQGNYLDPISCAGVGCFDDLPEKWKAILENEKYVVDGTPHFPVYSMEEYRKLPALLQEGIEAVTGLCRETLDIAAKCTADLAPKHIQQTAEYTGAFVYRFARLDALADGLYDHGHLLPVADDEKPAMCVIRY